MKAVLRNMDGSIPKCPRCRAPLIATGGEWLCPACALEDALNPGMSSESLHAPAGFPRPFGAYELLGELGCGGMGLVFRARQLSLGRTVALKVLVNGTFADIAGRHRFHAEAEAAARLQHPNIVAVHEVGEHEGVPFLTMDLIDGPDLGRLCNGRPLEARHAARLLRDIARAVDAAHAAGVLHRDLKPSNVLVGSDGRPMVTDFGLAKCRDIDTGATVTAFGQAIGSPSYAPPEQAAGRVDDISPASDIYGLGALLYHLLTGRAPFVAETPLQTLRLVLETEAVSPRALNPGTPRDLETICLRCLRKEPLRRYPGAGALADDLDRFLEQRPILARPPSLGYRASKFARRYRVVVGATAGVILALSVGLALALTGFHRALMHKRAADEARSQAERLNELLVKDLQPALEEYGKLPLLKKVTEETAAYFEKLPPELRSRRVDEEQATLLELLARLKGTSLEDPAGGKAALQAALQLRKKLARENPDDADANSAVLWDQTLYADVAGDEKAFRSIEYHRGLMIRWRKLAAQFPGNQLVERGLARALSNYAVGAMIAGQPSEAVTAAFESRTLIDRLLQLRPNDPRVRELAEWNTWMLTTSLQAAGDGDQALEACEREFTRLSEKLKTDPGNLPLRFLTAQAARSLSYRAKDTRMRDAELIAREHYLFLIGMDPDNRSYRYGYAAAHMMEAFYMSEYASRLDLARKIMSHHISLLEEFADTPSINGVREDLRRSHDFLARWAAREGDPSAADKHLEAMQSLIDANKIQYPDGSMERRLILLNLRQSAAWVAWLNRDWTTLLRRAEESLAEAQAGALAFPDNRNLKGFLAYMKAWRGLALLSLDRVGEAQMQLEQVLADRIFKPAEPYGMDTDAENLTRLATEALAEALAMTGNLPRARAMVLARMDWIEANLKPSSNRYFRERYACVLTILAGMLSTTDPMEAVRREQLLSRADDHLRGHEAIGPLSIYGRAIISSIEKRRLEQATAPLEPPDVPGRVAQLPSRL